MKELEVWLDIEGYEGLYQVSNLGRVRSLDRGMYVRQDRYPNGRWVSRKGKILKRYKRPGNRRQMVILSAHGIGKNHTVHRLVAKTHIPNPNNYPVVNHINHDYNDNRASNLEWCTQKQNIQHAIAAGRMNHIYAPNEINAKITKDQAIRAKELLAKGLDRSTVARMIGSTYDTVYHISVGDNWKHV